MERKKQDAPTLKDHNVPAHWTQHNNNNNNKTKFTFNIPHKKKPDNDSEYSSFVVVVTLREHPRGRRNIPLHFLRIFPKCCCWSVAAWFLRPLWPHRAKVEGGGDEKIIITDTGHYILDATFDAFPLYFFLRPKGEIEKENKWDSSFRSLFLSLFETTPTSSWSTKGEGRTAQTRTRQVKEEEEPLNFFSVSGRRNKKKEESY